MKRYIILHHWAVDQKDLDKMFQSYNKSHKTKLHPITNDYNNHIAYHYLVWGWDYMKTRPLRSVWYHASNRDINVESIGICMWWNFDVDTPTEYQYNKVNEIIEDIRIMYPDTEWIIEPHNKRANKTCPWNNVDFDRFLPSEQEWKWNTLLKKFNSLIFDRVTSPRIRKKLHDINEIIRGET